MIRNPFKSTKRDLPTKSVYITQTGRAYTPPSEYLNSDKVRATRKAFRDSNFGKALMNRKASPAAGS